MATSAPQSEGKWIVYSLLVIALVLLILVLRWPLLPNFIDIYYHLLCAEGFSDAGGYVTHDFWSWAPAGRPHLYPPVFHCLLLFLLKLGLPVITIARLCDVSVFILLLATLMWCMRGLFSGRAAFYCVLIASSLYSFYLSSSNFMPVTVACIFGLLSLYAAEKEKRVAAFLLLLLVFYTHAQMSWFFALAYLAYGVLNRRALTGSARIVGAALVVALPYLVYLFLNRRFYHPDLAHERFVIEINLSLLLAFIAVPFALREEGRTKMFVALGLAAIPFAFSYPYRYLSGQGLIGWVMLAGYGLGRLSDWRGRRWKIGVIGTALALVLISPAILVSPGGKVSFSLMNSTYRNLVFGHGRLRRPNEFSIASSRFMKELVLIIRNSSEPGDIVHANLNLAGTMLAALSRRYDAQGMVKEVVPYRRDDPIRSARLTIWFRDPTGSAEARTALEHVVSAPTLELLRETEIAYVFYNPSAAAVKDIPSPIIRFPYLLLMSGAFASLLAFALSRNRKVRQAA